MRRISIVGKVPANPRHVDEVADTSLDEADAASIVAQVTRALTAVGTVATALAALVACVAAMNTWTVAVLAVAWVLAGWLARGRRCHCAADRRHARLEHTVDGSVQA